MRRLLTYLLVLISGFSMILSGACTQAPTSAVSGQGNSGLEPTRVVVRILNLNVSPLTAPALQQQAPTPTPTLQQVQVPEPSQASVQATGEPVVQSSPTQGCTNQAEFIKHLSLSDYVEVKPKENYAKVWLVKNVGTCTWSTSYSLIYAGGDQLGAPDQVQLSQDVEPGETVELRITIVGPVEAKVYTGSWMLKDGAGNLFGVGDQANQPLVLIVQIIRHLRLTPP